MNYKNLLRIKYLKTLIQLFLIATNHAAIIQNPKLTNMDDGFLELNPNGSLILRSHSNNSSSVQLQEAVIFKTILNAIRLTPLQAENTLNDLNLKMYGDGVEHKFPPFLERVIQRIQTYFSVYRYTDTSQPVREDNKPTTTATFATSLATSTSGILNKPLTLGQNEIDDNLTSGNSNSFNKYNKTSLNADKLTTRPCKLNGTTSSCSCTTIKSTVVYDDEDKENEFIEIKSRKSVANKKS